jgi:hypothetical protein
MHVCIGVVGTVGTVGKVGFDINLFLKISNLFLKNDIIC